MISQINSFLHFNSVKVTYSCNFEKNEREVYIDLFIISYTP